MKSDIEIARSVKPRPINEIAKKVGIKESELIPWGKYKAKAPANNILKRVKNNIITDYG